MTARVSSFPISLIGMINVVAHEIGHNFNSQHDTNTECNVPISQRQTLMASCYGFVIIVLLD